MVAEDKGTGKFGVEVKYVSGDHVIEWFEHKVARDRYFDVMKNGALKSKLKTVKKRKR